MGGENLATVNGAAILPSTSACEVASVIEEGGLASQPAMSAGFSGVRAEFDGRVVISEYTFDIGPQWWAQGGDFAVFFFDAQGELASVGVTDGYDQLEGPDGITSRAVLKPYESCGLTGVPTASGTYKAFVFVPYPDTGAVAPPSGLQDLDALNYVSGWAPLGTYTVN